MHRYDHMLSAQDKDKLSDTYRNSSIGFGLFAGTIVGTSYSSFKYLKTASGIKIIAAGMLLNIAAMGIALYVQKKGTDFMSYLDAKYF
jgi:ABC-type uncharacterized transport system permease subunit